jgi:hypothetical protein
LTSPRGHGRRWAGRAAAKGRRALAHAADPMVCLVLRELHQRHRVRNERYNFILRHPVAHDRRQEGLTTLGPADISCDASPRWGGAGTQTSVVNPTVAPLGRVAQSEGALRHSLPRTRDFDDDPRQIGPADLAAWVRGQLAPCDATCLLAAAAGSCRARRSAQRLHQLRRTHPIPLADAPCQLLCSISVSPSAKGRTSHAHRNSPRCTVGILGCCFERNAAARKFQCGGAEL